VRILDFGLAKLMGSDSGLTMGMAVGTPNYMAPEQTREGTVDLRADLYAVGIVLFEMLTGKKPFDSTEMGEVFLKQLGMPPPRLREVKPEARFSPALEAVVLRAMQKAPNDRFPDADAMSQALEQVPEANATPGPEAVVIPPGPLPEATVLQLTPPPLFSGEHTSPDAAPPEMALPAPAVSPVGDGVGAPVAAPVPPRRRRLTGAAPTRRSTWVGLAVVGAIMAVALAVGFRPRQPPAKPQTGEASAAKSASGHSASRAPEAAAATPDRPPTPAPAAVEKRSAPEARTTAARSARSAGRNQRPGANAGRRRGPGARALRGPALGPGHRIVPDRCPPGTRPQVGSDIAEPAHLLAGHGQQGGAGGVPEGTGIGGASCSARRGPEPSQQQGARPRRRPGGARPPRARLPPGRSRS
jgi:hypothetical protein